MAPGLVMTTHSALAGSRRASRSVMGRVMKHLTRWAQREATASPAVVTRGSGVGVGVGVGVGTGVGVGGGGVAVGVG